MEIIESANTVNEKEVDNINSFNDIDLEPLNYIELSSFLNMAKNDKMKLEEYNNILKELKPLYENDNELFTNNSENVSYEKVLKDFENYEKEYNDNINSLNDAIDKLQNMIDKKYSQIEKSTLFITNQSIEVIDKELLKYNNIKNKYISEKNNIKVSEIEKYIKELENKKLIFENRGTMDKFIKHINDPASVINTMNNCITNAIESDELILNILTSKFDERKYIIVRAYLSMIYYHYYNKEYAMLASKALLYDLVKLMRNRNSLQAEIVFMNICDSIFGNYDLYNDIPGNNSNDLDSKMNSFDKYISNMMNIYIETMEKEKPSKLLSYKKSIRFKVDNKILDSYLEKYKSEKVLKSKIINKK